MTLSLPWDPARTRVIGRALSVASLLFIGPATLTPTTQRITWGPWCYLCGELGGVDVVLNVVLFIPLGMGLVLAGLRLPRAVIAAFLASLTVEVLQLEIVAGRDASLGDLFNNTMGGAIGAALGRHHLALLFPSRRMAARIAIAWGSAWVAYHAVAIFTFVPAPTGYPYFGQLGRALGGNPSYPGRILSAAIGDDAIPNTSFPSERAYRELATGGSGRVAATVIPRGHPPWRAHLVRVVDFHRREIVILTQDRDAVVFGVRTYAGLLRVRPPRIRLADVFPVSGGDTTHILARASSREMSLRADVGGRAATVHGRKTPGQAWRLLTPFQTYPSNSWIDIALAGVWLGVGLMPLGYWAVLASTRPSRRRPLGTRGIAVVACAPLAALLAVPLGMGTHVAPAAEWIAAIAGLFAGSLVGAQVMRGSAGHARA